MGEPEVASSEEPDWAPPSPCAAPLARPAGSPDPKPDPAPPPVLEKLLEALQLATNATAANAANEGVGLFGNLRSVAVPPASEIVAREGGAHAIKSTVGRSWSFEG